MQKVKIKTVHVPFGLEDTIANRVNEELDSLGITKENLISLDVKPVPMFQSVHTGSGDIVIRNGAMATIVYLTEKW